MLISFGLKTEVILCVGAPTLTGILQMEHMSCHHHCQGKYQSLFGRYIWCQQISVQQTPMAHDYINDTAEMEILPAAIRNKIINVQYNISGVEVCDTAPLIILITAVCDDSDGDVSQTLEYTKLQKVEGWDLEQHCWDRN